MPPKLVLFDCDGVLVDTETRTSEVMARNFQRYGLRVDATDMHSFFIGGTMMSAGQMARDLGADLPVNWLDEISAEVNEELAKGVDVFNGVFDLLDKLDHLEIATAVVSNGPLEKMQVSLGPCGLWDRFEGRIYSGRVLKPKPDPMMILMAIEQAKVTAEETIMIDDTTAGTRAADAAGVRAIGFAAASDAMKLKQTGHPVAMTMSEVQSLLKLN